MYADQITRSMDKAISETNRRRKIQHEYNLANNITPTTIIKKVRDLITISQKADLDADDLEKDFESMSKAELEAVSKDIKKKMNKAAAELNFELAAELRDKMIEVNKQLNEID